MQSSKLQLARKSMVIELCARLAEIEFAVEEEHSAWAKMVRRC